MSSYASYGHLIFSFNFQYFISTENKQRVGGMKKMHIIMVNSLGFLIVHLPHAGKSVHTIAILADEDQ